MIDADGWETVYATGGVTRVEPFIERDIRAAVCDLRGTLHYGPWGYQPPERRNLPPAGGVAGPGFRGPFR